jgi:hypothetical protein
MLHYILTTIGLRRDVVDPHWDDYIFGDEEPPRPDKFKTLTKGKANYSSFTPKRKLRPWTDDEAKFSLSTALNSIPDASILPIDSKVFSIEWLIQIFPPGPPFWPL